MPTAPSGGGSRLRGLLRGFSTIGGRQSGAAVISGATVGAARLRVAGVSTISDGAFYRVAFNNNAFFVGAVVARRVAKAVSSGASRIS